MESHAQSTPLGGVVETTQQVRSRCCCCDSWYLTKHKHGAPTLFFVAFPSFPLLSLTTSCWQSEQNRVAPSGFFGILPHPVGAPQSREPQCSTPLGKSLRGLACLPACLPSPLRAPDIYCGRVFGPRPERSRVFHAEKGGFDTKRAAQLKHDGGRKRQPPSRVPVPAFFSAARSLLCWFAAGRP